MIKGDEIVKVDVSDEAFLLGFGSFFCSHPQSAVDYDEKEHYTEYNKEQPHSRGCHLFKHSAFTLEGMDKAP